MQVSLTSAISPISIINNSNNFLEGFVGANWFRQLSLQSFKNLFKSLLTSIKYSNGGCSLTVEYEPVEFFLEMDIYRTLGTRVRLPPSAFKLLRSNSCGVSLIGERVRLSEGSIARTEESENRIFSELPSAFSSGGLTW